VRVVLPVVYTYLRLICAVFAAGREPPVEMAKSSGWQAGGRGSAGADFGGFPVRWAENGQKGQERAFLGEMGCFQGFWRVPGSFSDSLLTKNSQRTTFDSQMTGKNSQRTASVGETTRENSQTTASLWGMATPLGERTAALGGRAASLGGRAASLGERTARFGGGKKSLKRVARVGRAGNLARLAVNKPKLIRRSCFAPGTAQTNFGMLGSGTRPPSRYLINV